MSASKENHRDYLEHLFNVGVTACHPSVALQKFFSEFSLPAVTGEIIVVGAGKASVEMATEVHKYFSGKVRGAVVTRHGQAIGSDLGGIEVLYANHPVPDHHSVEAADKIVEICRSASASDLVLFLVSGGGSALLTRPADGIGLQQLTEITDRLVKSGLPITDINCCRRHLSSVKGGRLAAMMQPAMVITLAISDVVGDSPADVASGPSYVSAYEPDRVFDLLGLAGVEISKNLRQVIMHNKSPADVTGEYHFVANADSALNAIEHQLKQDGWRVINLGTHFTGDATQTAKEHAAQFCKPQINAEKTAYISGGELTVKVVNENGRGGPNLEYLSSLVTAMTGEFEYHSVACDSDGIDGTQDNAGGYVNSKFCENVKGGIDTIKRYLAENRSYDLFEDIGGLVKTGTTGTNVNDIRITLIDQK